MSKVIELEGVEVRYGDFVALRDAALTIEQGQPLVLLGRNGAGKTTLLSALAGLLTPSRGRIHVPRGLTVSYLPEDRGLYASMTVQEHLAYFADLAQVPRSTIDRWVDAFEISEYMDLHVSELSKGNQQRVQLACSLIDSPDCVLLDEPFSGLDPIGQRVVTAVLRDYARTHWLVLSAHEVDSVARLAANLAFIKKGRIVAAGPVAALSAAYGTNSLLVSSPARLESALRRHPGLTASPTPEGWLKVDGLRGYREAITLLTQVSGDPGEFHWRPPSLSDLFMMILEKEDPDHE